MARIDKKAFVKSVKTQDAVLRRIEIIGEAANKVPARFIALNGHIISELKIKNKWIMADAL